MEKRTRTKRILTLNERLLAVAEDCRARAQLIKPGKEQNELLDKARQFENQIGVNLFL